MSHVCDTYEREAWGSQNIGERLHQLRTNLVDSTIILHGEVEEGRCRCTQVEIINLASREGLLLVSELLVGAVRSMVSSSELSRMTLVPEGIVVTEILDKEGEVDEVFQAQAREQEAEDEAKVYCLAHPIAELDFRPLSLSPDPDFLANWASTFP